MLRIPALVLAAALVMSCQQTQPATDATPGTGAAATGAVTPAAPAPGATAASPTSNVRVTGSGLKIEDLVLGSGAEAATGRTVAVHYTGWLTDNTQFDSSVGGAPYPVTLGRRGVIAGWEEGIPGMKVGGKRRLTIPSSLAYGDQGHPAGIPPKATLIFEIELVEVR